MGLIDTGDLFDGGGDESAKKSGKRKPAPLRADAPLAERMRPKSWAEFRAPEGFDRKLLERLQAGKGRPPSMVFWGPPGSGKTTLARLVGETFDCAFEPFSAVLGGVKEVREIIDRAGARKQPTLLFVDEIHRFNKAQQDAFLPHVESGAVVLIGATTENPSFALTQALLSRVRVVTFPPLAEPDLLPILDAAIAAAGLQLSPDGKPTILQAAAGDARRLINFVDLLAKLERPDPTAPLTAADVTNVLKHSGAYVYDRAGDHHYDMISAFIKSLRGSDPDAALYWGFRMLESGEDPRFLCRRMMIFASEDVGNADPHALPLAVATATAFEKLGLPEGRIPIAQCITYLATAEKSNRSYKAMGAATTAIAKDPRADVPLHLRNAPTALMESLGHGAGYQYPHEGKDGYIAGIRYLPDIVGDAHFYEPSDIGAEKAIRERQERRKTSGP